MVVEKWAIFSRYFILACKWERVGLKLELFEQDFSNYALSKLHCEVLSYHFKSIYLYYNHHHFITNENNYIKLFFILERLKIKFIVKLFNFVSFLYPSRIQYFSTIRPDSKCSILCTPKHYFTTYIFYIEFKYMYSICLDIHALRMLLSINEFLLHSLNHDVKLIS